jgi:hypothetical protein
MAAATNPSDFELKMRMFRRVASASPKTPGETEAVPAVAPAGGGMDGITNGAGGFDFYQQ